MALTIYQGKQNSCL